MTATEIEAYIDTHLCVQDLFFDEGVHFRSLVEECFLLPHKKVPEEARAISILSVLFSFLVKGADFPLFVQNFTSKKELKSFVSCLLYHIFSLTFPLEHLRSNKELEAYLFRIMASLSSKKTVARFWSSLTLDQKIRTVGFCAAYYDEGSYALFQVMKTEKTFASLYEKIETGLIHKDSLWNFAKNTETLTLDALKAFEKEQDDIISEAVLELGVDSKFVHIFGLYGHQIPLKSASLTDDMNLVEKLQADVNFAARVNVHITALNEGKKPYVEGLEQIIYCIPTCGRSLEEMPSLPSLLEGFKKMGSILDLDLSCYPVFIFDQSTPAQFQKNAKFVERLQKKYTTPIVHKSKKELITLANAHNCHDLIITGLHERFGYAGARNAIFLLGPLLHAEHFKKKIESPVIMMCDDDLFIPASNLFSDALFASEQKGNYFSRFGCIVGRATTEVFASIDLVLCLTQANKILSQCFWNTMALPHYMSTLLTSPKFCLNIPLGQEENHFLDLKSFDFDFRKPALHLAGWRYPKNTLPTNRYSGLTSHLEGLNKYVLGLLLVAELLDPCNLSGKCALVWNLEKEPCKSFKDALTLLQDPLIVQRMQDQFWKNFETFLEGFFDLSPYDETALTSNSKIMQKLLEKDIDVALQEHCKLDPFILSCKKELKEMKQFFTRMAQEARWFKEFALNLQSERKKGIYMPQEAVQRAKEAIEKSSQKAIEEHYFTNSLYTLCNAVGAAGFQKALKVLA